MPQVDLQAIKDSLPEWPDDVIEQWLLPFAKDLGWPPPVPLGEHRWHYILAKKPLSWWQGLKWELRDIDLQKSHLSARDRNMADQMTQAYIYGMTNAYSSIESGRERMASALIFIARNGHLPRAPIAVEGKDGLQFVDGSHRVVAWVTYREFTENQRNEVGAKEIDPAQAIWVGIQMSETDTDLT